MSAKPTPRRRAAAMPPERRAQSILDAARAVFIERGYDAARIDDVARRAGIAKGTVYLHFDSKAALFQALVSSLAAPPLGRIAAMLEAPDAPSADLLRQAVGIIRREILETDRRLIIRLILTEAHRFPEIAEYHYREVVERALGLLRRIVARGIARGEFADDTLTRFPQLFAAPFVLAVLWEGLFGRLAPLDAEALLDAHVELLLRGMAARP